MSRECTLDRAALERIELQCLIPTPGACELRRGRYGRDEFLVVPGLEYEVRGTALQCIDSERHAAVGGHQNDCQGRIEGLHARKTVQPRGPAALTDHEVHVQEHRVEDGTRQYILQQRQRLDGLNVGNIAQGNPCAATHVRIVFDDKNGVS